MTKKTKILVVSSLLLNVLLIGVIIGGMSHKLRREHLFENHARDVISNLPEDKAELFLETFETVHQINREADKRIREARKQSMKILTAPDFDETAFRIQVEKLHELRGSMMRRLADSAMELAKQFNQEERKVMAQLLRNPPRPPWDAGPQRPIGPPYPEVP